MKTSFPYEDKPSTLFEGLKRPVADVKFWSAKRKRWLICRMVVDTGADYSVLPETFARDLAIDLKKECLTIKTAGVGGEQKVYLLKKKILTKVGSSRKRIPLGFLARGNNQYEIPPLLGRYKALDSFGVCFKNFRVTFED